MQMTKAQAIAELEHIYEILPLIAEAVKEEKLLLDSWFLGLTDINREYNCITFL